MLTLLHLFSLLILLITQQAVTATTQTPMRTVTGGTSFFFTAHSDAACLNTQFSYKTLEYLSSTANNINTKATLRINTCLPSPTGYFILTCKMGATAFTLTETTFAAGDSTCASPLQTSSPSGARAPVFQHGALCQPDPANGGFKKVHCGEDATLTQTLPSLPALLAPALFKNPTCSVTSPLSAFTLLNVCTPRYASTSKGKMAAYYYKLSITSRTPLSVTMLKYDKADPTCKNRIASQKNITYPPLPTNTNTNTIPVCMPDPVWGAGFFYQNTAASAPRPR